jgi:hypothetical protein
MGLLIVLILVAIIFAFIFGSQNSPGRSSSLDKAEQDLLEEKRRREAAKAARENGRSRDLAGCQSAGRAFARKATSRRIAVDEVRDVDDGRSDLGVWLIGMGIRAFYVGTDGCLYTGGTPGIHPVTKSSQIFDYDYAYAFETNGPVETISAMLADRLQQR